MDIRDAALLAFLGSERSRYPIDQIRVMKAFFLLDHEGPDELRELYDFQPYDYGPFDVTVYRDLDRLESEGLIRSQSVGNSRQRIYELTEEGRRRLPDASATLDEPSRAALQEVAVHVTSMDFASLLRSIYKKYPDSAVRSVFRR